MGCRGKAWPVRRSPDYQSLAVLHTAFYQHLMDNPALFAALMAQMHPSVSSNDELVERLRASGTPDKVLSAFKEVDRGFFAPEDESCSPYDDMPVRRGKLHLSAPGIYAKVLEAFDLQEGMSFLN